jgi:SAM-dependent methyltransferase
MANYLRHAFYRFLYTLDIVPPGKGKLLEIGASPYFMTLLLEKYTNYQLTLTNHFGNEVPGSTAVEVKYNDLGSKKDFAYRDVNVEKDQLPFPNGHFEVALFCEVIEHLPQDALAALLEIKRVLKPGGYLIVTTPNVGRLENVVRMLTRQNIYDPYSGYGVYVRHNREFTTDELSKLLNHAGFEVEKMFTSDVTPNHVFNQYPVQSLLPMLKGREERLGEYIFTLARSSREPTTQKPR